MSIQAINVRNQFKGKVREIIRGDVVSEVDVETPWGIVTSVITTPQWTTSVWSWVRTWWRWSNRPRCRSPNCERFQAQIGFQRLCSKRWKLSNA